MSLEKDLVKKLIELTNAKKLKWNGNDVGGYLAEYSDSGGIIQLFNEGGHLSIEVDGTSISESDLDFDGSLDELETAIRGYRVKTYPMPTVPSREECIKYTLDQLDKLGQ